MSEVQIFDVTVEDVHGNCVGDTFRVYARDAKHAEIMALDDAADKYPLNHMGCDRPIFVSRSACWRCGTTEIFDGELRVCPECFD